MGGQQFQRRIQFLQQLVLLHQLPVDLRDLVFLLLAVVDVERHADQALARRVRVAVHDAAVVGKPDPLARLGAQPELGAVLRRGARHMVGHRLPDPFQITGVKQGKDVLQAGRHFVLGKAQLPEGLGRLVRDLAGDQVVLPKIKTGGFKRQCQTILVQVFFSVAHRHWHLVSAPPC